MKKRTVLHPVFFLILCFSLFIFQPVFSQEMQTGKIIGKVVDDKGEPLPGVSITVTGPALQGKMSAVTNPEGVYRVVGLPPGTDYEVRAELPGFETIIRKGIIVRVGSTVTIDLQIKPSEVKEEVVVTAPSPTVDVARSTKSTVVTKEVLASLPLSRDFANFTAIVPGAIGRSVQGGGSREMTAVVDGIPDNSAGSGAANLPPHFAWDMVEEVEIVASGASAEYYGSPTGQAIMVMKSGGNKLTGGFSLYYTNKNLVQVHLPEPDLATLNMAKPSAPVYSIDFSAEMGGAIIKDRLWYMTNFRYLNNKYNGSFKPTVINGKQYDNYDRFVYDYIGYIKLTFQLAHNLRGNVMAHYSDYFLPYNDSGWNITNEANPQNGRKQLHLSGNIFWFIDSNTVLSLKAGGAEDWWFKRPSKEADPDSTRFIDRYTGYQWGNWTGNRYSIQESRNIALSLTKFVDNLLGGDHEFKAGIEWEWGRNKPGFHWKYPLIWYYYNGSPYYWRAQNNGVRDPVYGDGQLEYAAIGATKWASYSEGIDSRIGGFIQESYKIKLLTANVGVRFDNIKTRIPGRVKRATADPVAMAIGEYYFKPVYGINPYDEIAYPTWDNAFPYGVFISPRIGLTYDLFGNHKTALKVSFAHQPLPFGTSHYYNMYPLAYRSYTFNWWDLNENGRPDPPPGDRYQEALGKTPLEMVSDTYLKAIDPNVKPPHMDEFNFGIEHELIRDFQLSVHYIIRKRGNILASVLWDEESGRYWYSYEKAPEWWIPFKTTVPAYGIFPAQEVTMYFLSKNAPAQFRRLTNIPEASWKYRTLEIAFNKRMSNGWQLGGSVNFSKSLGDFPIDLANLDALETFSDANSFVNAYGELPFSRPVCIKLYGNFHLPYQIMFSFIFQHIDGSPWGRTVRVLPPKAWAQAHNASTVGYTIYVEPPGTRRNEASDNLDIRLQKDFNIGPGRVGFYVDVFNLLGAYTLTITKNPGGTWKPAEEGGTTGTFTPGSLGLKGFSGYREFRFSILYRF